MMSQEGGRLMNAALRATVIIPRCTSQRWMSEETTGSHSLHCTSVLCEFVQVFDCCPLHVECPKEKKTTGTTLDSMSENLMKSGRRHTLTVALIESTRWTDVTCPVIETANATGWKK